MAADEVVQLYHSRRDVPFRVPQYDLKGFQRIHLEPGMSEVLLFTVSPEDFLLINEAGEAVYLPGTLRIFVGGSLPDARSIALGAAPGLRAEIILE
jgi:beta-glucosidase